jgi:hypothetical protein
MPAKLCSGTTTAGTPCRAVALAGSRLCRAHQKNACRTRRQQRANRPPAIRLGIFDTHPAILRNYSRLAQALAADTIHLDRATAMINQLQRATNELIANLSRC